MTILVYRNNCALAAGAIAALTTLGSGCGGGPAKLTDAQKAVVRDTADQVSTTVQAPSRAKSTRSQSSSPSLGGISLARGASTASVSSGSSRVELMASAMNQSHC